MRLLIITQKMDKNDPILGFFHGWVAEFAKRFESIIVICLEKGTYDLPANVKVLSLGKESHKYRLKFINRLCFIARFYRFIWRERNHYDAVFVHMNQEYVLLGGLIWRLWGRKVYMWRNHHSGSYLTDLVAFFCTKVFCTSKYSYTAKYKKIVLMPVGINTELFVRRPEIVKIPRSILFLGRIAPVKKPNLLIEALIGLKKQDIEFMASLYGDALPIDQKYYESLIETVKNAGLSDVVTFYPGIPNERTVEVYNKHEVFVNLSSSGMYDKTIFEAMACGVLVLASNDNLRRQIDDVSIFKQNDAYELTNKLINILGSSIEEKKRIGGQLLVLVRRHSLSNLAEELFTNIS